MPNGLGGPIFHGNNRGLYLIDQQVNVPSVQVTANSTLTLDAGSKTAQVFTGTTAGQILKMPDATTLPLGRVFDVWNLSSQNITINNNSNTLLATLKPNGRTVVFLRDNSTAAGVWSLTYTLDNGNVFGTQIYLVTDESETSNNSGTIWVNKLTLTTPSDLPLGDYLIQFQFIWRSSSANREADFRIQLNGSNIVAWSPSTGRTQDRQLLSGFRRTDGISGVNSYTFDFKWLTTSTTIFVQQARMFVWRVA